MLTKTLVGTAVRLAQRPNEMPDMELGYLFQECPNCGCGSLDKGYKVAYMMALAPPNTEKRTHGIKLIAWCPCGAIFAIHYDGKSILLAD